MIRSLYAELALESLSLARSGFFPPHWEGFLLKRRLLDNSGNSANHTASTSPNSARVSSIFGTFGTPAMKVIRFDESTERRQIGHGGKMHYCLIIRK